MRSLRLSSVMPVSVVAGQRLDLELERAPGGVGAEVDHVAERRPACR